MPRKRKRHSSDEIFDSRPEKRAKSTNSSTQKSYEIAHKYPVLPLYYPHVSSLREFLLFQIPLSSRSRRRKIKSLGTDKHLSADGHTNPLSALLDSVVVGYFGNLDQSTEESRRKELTQFSLTQLNQTIGSTPSGPAFSQSEVCCTLPFFIQARTAPFFHHTGCSPSFSLFHVLIND
jgi:telomerase reverse transcriptase